MHSTNNDQLLGIIGGGEPSHASTCSNLMIVGGVHNHKEKRKLAVHTYSKTNIIKNRIANTEANYIFVSNSWDGSLLMGHGLPFETSYYG